VFRGRYEHAIDGKGRTSLPSRFREVLAGLGDMRVVITTGLEEHLVAHPFKEWQACEERLAALPSFDRSVIALKRIYVSGSVEVEVDKLGRVLVPPTLRKHAGLSRELLWAGMGKYIELWDRERFELGCNKVLHDEPTRDGIAARLAELGL
jgi:MraZ protein